MSSGQFWHEEREFERSADFPRHGQAHRLHGVPYNTLTCVHRFNGRRPLDVYRFLRQELGSTYIQFIPVVEHKSFERVAPQTWQPEMLPKDGEAAAAAQRGKPALSAVTARERLSRIVGVSDELRALDHVPPETGL